MRRHCERGTGSATLSEKGSNRPQNTTHCRGRRETSAVKIGDFTKEGSTSILTATPTKNALEVMQVGSNPRSISTPDTPNTKGSSVSFSGSALFCRECLKYFHRQAQYPFIRSHLWPRFAAQRKNKLEGTSIKTAERYRYQPSGAHNWRPQQLPAQQVNMQRTLPEPSPSANDQSKSRRRRTSER